MISNANRASVLSCDSISATIGLSFPKITLIYYDKPVSQTFIPGCHRVPLNTLDSVDTVLLKVYRDEEDNLYLKFDASLDFSAQEIDRMAVRMDALLMKI